MGKNASLRKADKVENDEFYKQYDYIQKEINAYLEYDPDVFKEKTVLLPCDDLEWSNFTKFLAQNFENFGLKKLISTSYAYESKNYKGYYQLSLFESDSPQCLIGGNIQPHRKTLIYSNKVHIFSLGSCAIGITIREI